MCDFNPQALANTAWAFAKACQLDDLSLSALAKASERRMCDFGPQNLANTAWAFAYARNFDEPLCLRHWPRWRRCACATSTRTNAARCLKKKPYQLLGPNYHLKAFLTLC